MIAERLLKKREEDLDDDDDEQVYKIEPSSNGGNDEIGIKNEAAWYSWNCRWWWGVGRQSGKTGEKGICDDLAGGEGEATGQKAGDSNPFDGPRKTCQQFDFNQLRVPWHLLNPRRACPSSFLSPVSTIESFELRVEALINHSNTYSISSLPIVWGRANLAHFTFFSNLNSQVVALRSIISPDNLSPTIMTHSISNIPDQVFVHKLSIQRTVKKLLQSKCHPGGSFLLLFVHHSHFKSPRTKPKPHNETVDRPKASQSPVLGEKISLLMQPSTYSLLPLGAPKNHASNLSGNPERRIRITWKQIGSPSNVLLPALYRFHHSRSSGMRFMISSPTLHGPYFYGYGCVLLSRPLRCSPSKYLLESFLTSEKRRWQGIQDHIKRMYYTPCVISQLSKIDKLYYGNTHVEIAVLWWADRLHVTWNYTPESTNYASVQNVSKTSLTNKYTNTHNMRYRPAWPRDFVIGLRQKTTDPCAKCPEGERLDRYNNKCFW